MKKLDHLDSSWALKTGQKRPFRVKKLRRLETLQPSPHSFNGLYIRPTIPARYGLMLYSSPVRLFQDCEFPTDSHKILDTRQEQFTTRGVAMLSQRMSAVEREFSLTREKHMQALNDTVQAFYIVLQYHGRCFHLLACWQMLAVHSLFARTLVVATTD